MRITQQLKELLLRVNDSLPPDKRAEFASRIRMRLQAVQLDDLVGYTIAGALLGAICDILPIGAATGVDDWTEVGAALGAAVGYVATRKTRQTCKDIEQLIAEEVDRVMADAH